MKPEDFLLQLSKQQLDAAFRIVETILEGATMMREAQLEAAVGAHADAIATQRAIAAATGAAELLRLQTQWAKANVEKSIAYWRSTYETAMQTNAELAKCLWTQAPGATAQGFKGGELDASKDVLLGMIDNACRQWLDATQQFYKPIERISA